MNWLELKIPPVLLVALFALLMWLTAKLLPSLTVILPAEGFFAGILFVSGLAIVSWAAFGFKKFNTTLNPLSPEQASALVTTGLFRVSRNPMYLGFLLCLAAYAVWLSNLLAFLLLPGFVLYMNRFQIVPEERSLSRIFGAAYQEYIKSVRRWL